MGRRLLADIAAEVGVAKMTSYNYCGDKEGLVLRVFKRVFDDAFAKAESIVDGPTNAVDNLAAIIALKADVAARFSGAVVWRTGVLSKNGSNEEGC